MWSASQDEQAFAAEEVRPVEVSPNKRYLRYSTLLGRGACKRVYKAFDVVDGLEVAWNQVEMVGIQDDEERERLFSEIHTLQQLHHRNIMSFHDWWYDEQAQTINFITEVFSSGSLRQYRKRMKSSINDTVIKRWSWQILQGLVYLHGHEPPIVHRDLKADNCFINANGLASQVKIGDLGLATALKGNSVVGTPEFMAPEIYDEVYDEKVDIYSFGMCLLELATLEYPYKECSFPTQIYKKVITGVKPKAIDKVISQDLRELIEQCIAHDPKERPSARELLRHPFFETLRQEGSLHSSMGSCTQLAALQHDQSMPHHVSYAGTPSPHNMHQYVQESAPGRETFTSLHGSKTSPALLTQLAGNAAGVQATHHQHPSSRLSSVTTHGDVSNVQAPHGISSSAAAAAASAQQQQHAAQTQAMSSIPSQDGYDETESRDRSGSGSSAASVTTMGIIQQRAGNAPPAAAGLLVHRNPAVNPLIASHPIPSTDSFISMAGNIHLIEPEERAGSGVPPVSPELLSAFAAASSERFDNPDSQPNDDLSGPIPTLKDVKGGVPCETPEGSLNKKYMEDRRRRSEQQARDTDQISAQHSHMVAARWRAAVQRMGVPANSHTVLTASINLAQLSRTAVPELTPPPANAMSHLARRSREQPSLFSQMDTLSQYAHQRSASISCRTHTHTTSGVRSQHTNESLASGTAADSASGAMTVADMHHLHGASIHVSHRPSGENDSDSSEGSLEEVLVPLDAFIQDAEAEHEAEQQQTVHGHSDGSLQARVSLLSAFLESPSHSTGLLRYQYSKAPGSYTHSLRSSLSIRPSASLEHHSNSGNMSGAFAQGDIGIRSLTQEVPVTMSVSTARGSVDRATVNTGVRRTNTLERPSASSSVTRGSTPPRPPGRHQRTKSDNTLPCDSLGSNPVSPHAATAAGGYGSYCTSPVARAQLSPFYMSTPSRYDAAGTRVSSYGPLRSPNMSPGSISGGGAAVHPGLPRSRSPRQVVSASNLLNSQTEHQQQFTTPPTSGPIIRTGSVGVTGSVGDGSKPASPRSSRMSRMTSGAESCRQGSLILQSDPTLAPDAVHHLAHEPGTVVPATSHQATAQPSDLVENRPRGSSFNLSPATAAALHQKLGVVTAQQLGVKVTSPLGFTSTGMVDLPPSGNQSPLAANAVLLPASQSFHVASHQHVSKVRVGAMRSLATRSAGLDTNNDSLLFGIEAGPVEYTKPVAGIIVRVRRRRGQQLYQPGLEQHMQLQSAPSMEFTRCQSL